MLVCPAIFSWTLLFGYLADVFASVYVANIVVFGRCYCHMPYCGRCCTTRSDVVTCFLLWCRCCYHMVYIVVCSFDMFGTCCCHCFCDWWYCHILILMLIYWQMLCQVVMYHWKNCRTHQHCDTIKCWKCLRLTFSSDLEEAMLEMCESLSTTKIKFCLWDLQLTYLRLNRMRNIRAKCQEMF